MGRPRIYPLGSPASARVNASVAALKEAGGDRKTFRLSPQAMRALESLRRAGGGTDTEIVERAILAAAAAVSSSDKNGAKR